MTKAKTKTSPDHGCLHVVPRIEEEAWAVKRGELTDLDYGPNRLLKAVGESLAGQAGGIVISRNITGHVTDLACFCPDGLPGELDTEHLPLMLMRVQRREVFCPRHQHTITIGALISRYTKTTSDKRKLYLKFREPPLPRWYWTQAGRDYERCGVSGDLRKAVAAAAPTPDEPFRAGVLDCDSLTLAREIVGQQSDTLPSVEGLKLRGDGDLDADWHGMPLSPEERRLHDHQTNADRIMKTARLDKLIRQVRAEHA